MMALISGHEYMTKTILVDDNCFYGVHSVYDGVKNLVETKKALSL